MGNYWTICPVVKKGVKGLLFIDDLCAKVHFINIFDRDNDFLYIAPCFN